MIGRVRSSAERGAATVEYALLVVAFVVAILAVSAALGNVAKASYRNSCSTVSSPTGSAATGDTNCTK